MIRWLRRLFRRGRTRPLSPMEQLLVVGTLKVGEGMTWDEVKLESLTSPEGETSDIT